GSVVDGERHLAVEDDVCFFFQAEDGIRDLTVTGVQTCALPIASNLLEDARRFEAGSLNSTGVFGLRAAIDLLLDAGIDNIAAEVIDLATRLADGLESIGFEVRTPRPIRSGIVGAAVNDGRELLRLHGELEKEGIVCAPREGMLRFSPHFYNEESEVERVLEVLRRR